MPVVIKFWNFTELEYTHFYFIEYATILLRIFGLRLKYVETLQQRAIQVSAGYQWCTI